jgi:hypothetical protein
MALFSVADLQDSFEKLKKSLEWIRELIRKRDWPGLLTLAAAVLFLVGWTAPDPFLSSTPMGRWGLKWTLRIVAGGTGLLCSWPLWSGCSCGVRHQLPLALLSTPLSRLRMPSSSPDSSVRRSCANASVR